MSRIDTLVDKIQEEAAVYNKQLAVWERLEAQLDNFITEEDRIKEILDVEEQAHAILFALENEWRKDFEKNVERIISEGIELVFGEKIDFRIVSSVKASASAVEFELETAAGTADIMNAEGGSLVQVVSFLLRVLIILAFKPALEPFIVLDEAFNGVGTANVQNVALLVQKVTKETGIQVLMVTHDPTYIDYADKAYEVNKVKGIGAIKEL